MPTGVEVKKVNYNNPSSLVEALKDQEVLVITMAATAPKEQQTKLIEAAAAANVPWVLPNEFGGDPTEKQVCIRLVFQRQPERYAGFCYARDRHQFERLESELRAGQGAL
ncbi:unnamed protein product [Didymodactylos carnosus]|uniref:NmrA-like domain-containing protein n=1 Tax=Didymodactylos carnosus TaxID=1234261 RepID=A0A815W7D5_9BILA|nr:unnamed protein product [Didymodactylos carnosus]CAF4404817.1 unnamed protein product [Didymodactylos carnosus]